VWEETSLFARTFGRLRAELPGQTGGETVVPIEEAFWRPRPTQATLPAGLPAVVLVGNGVIGFKGIMTQARGRALLATPDLGDPDKAAVRDLYAATLSTGLGGGELKLIARRGSAPAHSSPLEPAALDPTP
jgi:hypothetical protein